LRIKTFPSPVDHVTHQDLKSHIRDILAELPEREAKVIQMRFALGYDYEHTLEEVGKAFAVTRERISGCAIVSSDELKMESEELSKRAEMEIIQLRKRGKVMKTF